MDDNFKGIQLKPMVDRVKRFQALNNQVGQLSYVSREIDFYQKHFYIGCFLYFCSEILCNLNSFSDLLNCEQIYQETLVAMMIDPNIVSDSMK